jgi:hypothetical protein
MPLDEGELMVQHDGAAVWGSGNGAWGTPSGGAPTPPTGFSGEPDSTPAWRPDGPSSNGIVGEPISAPMAWLALAGVLELVGLVLGLRAGNSPTLSLAGWIVGGFGAISVLAWFTLADSKRRTSSWYSAGAAPTAIRGALALAAVLVVTINAYDFADWASRR